MASQVDPVQAPHRIVDSPLHRSVSLEEEEEERTLASGLLVHETQGRITPFELSDLTEVTALHSQNNLDMSKPAAARRSVTMEPMNPDLDDVGAGALLKSKEPLEVENNSETLDTNHPPEFPEDEYIFYEQTWANLMAETESPTQDQLYKTSTEPLPAGVNMDFLEAPDACNDGNIPDAAPQSEKHSEEDNTSDSDRRKKRPNTQTGPQRPLSAYNLFFRDFRRKLIDQHGGPLPFSTLGKEVGKTWKSLSKKERKHWEDQSEVDSQRYQQEVKELRAEIRAKRRRASFLHVTEHSSTETGMAEHSIDNKANLTCTSGENKPRVHLCHQPAAVAPAHQAPAPLYAREVFGSSAIEAGSLPQDLPLSGTIIPWPEVGTGIVKPHVMQWKVYCVKASQASQFMEYMRATPTAAYPPAPGAHVPFYSVNQACTFPAHPYSHQPPMFYAPTIASVAPPAMGSHSPVPHAQLQAPSQQQHHSASSHQAHWPSQYPQVPPTQQHDARHFQPV